MKQLVVTGDDFGAAIEVNEAIERAHREGVLTAASLMVGGPAAGDAVLRARRNPSLRVGLHLVLVDGSPILGPSAARDLVGRDGRFRSNMTAAGVNLFFSPRARAQLAAEIAAQYAAFRATGLALDHVNAHKHFHLHPVIGRLMIEIGQRFGVPAMRVPSEPAQIIRAIEPGSAVSAGPAVGPWANLLRRRVRKAGLLAPDRVFGLRWSGALTKARLSSLLRLLPDGLTEIYCHPATAAYAGAAPGYRYAEELHALTAPEVVAALRNGSVRSGGFSDFTRAENAERVTPAAMAIEPDRSVIP